MMNIPSVNTPLNIKHRMVVQWTQIYVESKNLFILLMQNEIVS